MAERAAYPPVAPPPDLAAYVQMQNVRLGRLAAQVDRGQRLRHRITSAATTLTEADDVLLVDTTGGNVTVTLPAAQGVPGQEVVVKKLVAANTMTVAAAGSDLIDGAASVATATQWAVIRVASVITAAPATWGWVRTT